MKILNSIFQATFLCALFILNSCNDDIVIPNDDPISDFIAEENRKLAAVVTSAEVQAYLTGTISDENNQPLNNVEVFYGNKKVLTDADGVFTFGEIALNAEFAVVKAKLNGYLTGYRTFTPHEDAFNRVRIQLLKLDPPKSFEATNGAELTIDSEIKLNFAANGISKMDGEAYNGKVMVYGRYLDPVAENIGEIMPGTLVGLAEDGDLDAMQTFGMLNIELQDEAGNQL